MRAWGLLAILALAGCSGEPKLRADSEANFRRSYERIARVASAERLATLDGALKAILQARARIYDMDRTEGFSGAAEIAPGSRAFTPLVENWTQARAALVASQIGPMVDERTIDEVLALAARREAAAAARLAQWAARLNAPLDGMWRIERVPQIPVLGERDKELLARVKITGESQMALGAGDGARGVVAFLIENGLETPLRSVLLSTRDPARAGEALEASFEYVFPASLPPGSTQRVISRIVWPAQGLAPGLKSALRLHVAGVQDKAGQAIGLAARAGEPEPPEAWDPLSQRPSYH
ncbi:MAG: hypothetical protein JWN93_3187 [Hyphomicrobiales bacterium]|nr:hypothetical protein [Hyphomicrobiales bacterium]